jgi:GAF domain-containing protein/CheY-like chemotaxis protein
MVKRFNIAEMGRVAAVICAYALYVWLLCYDAYGTFSTPPTRYASFMRLLTEYSFSALVAFLYLTVGSLAFLYIRHRWLGFVLFAFCCSTAATFTQETGSVLARAESPLISSAASSLALLLLAVLLLIFPHNYLGHQGKGGRGRKAPVRWLLLSYIATLGLLLVLSLVILPFGGNMLAARLSVTWNSRAHDVLVALPPALDLLGCLITMIVTYRRSTEERERQQVRIVAIGMLLAFAPFFALTLLPSVALGYSYAVDGQVSTLTFGLVPVFFAYAIMRFHLLIVDRHIRSAVSLLVGGVTLAVAGYLVFFACSIALPSAWPQLKWCVAVVMLLLIPAVGRFAPWVTERVFAPDLTSAHRLLYSNYLAADRALVDNAPLEAIARQLMLTARALTGAQQVGFFVFHQESGSYRPVDPGLEHTGEDAPTDLLLSVLAQQGHSGTAPQRWIDARNPLIALLSGARRPLYLGETRALRGTGRAQRLARIFCWPTASQDPLLAPVMAPGRANGSDMLGLLVLGSRENRIPYAGPDFEVITLLLLRFSWLLGKALVDEQSREHIALLNALYATTSIVSPPEQDAEELAAVYAQEAASAMKGGAEVWLYDSPAHVLHRAAQAGSAPTLPYGEQLRPREESDWTCWFYEGRTQLWEEDHEQLRPFVLEPPGFPFAWLPLIQGSQPLGVLVLTYPLAYRHFSSAERQVLELFAHQCASALANERIARELRAAASSQHEQDRLMRQGTKLALQHLLHPLVSIGRYAEVLRRDQLSVNQEALAASSLPPDDTLPLQGVALPALQEELEGLVASIRASLLQLRDIATMQTSGSAADTAINARFRRQVNNILSGFDIKEGPLILIITPDPDFRAMLTAVLNLGGYLTAEAASCQEAAEWVRQGAQQGIVPSALLFDGSLLGIMPLSDLLGELQRPLPPLLLMGASVSPHPYDAPATSNLPMPFTAQALVVRVQSCLAGSASDDR